MASLDAFLADLDDLQDEEDEGVEEGDGAYDDGEEGDEDDVDMLGDGAEPKAVSGLLTSSKMVQLMQLVEARMEADSSALATTGSGASSVRSCHAALPPRRASAMPRFHHAALPPRRASAMPRFRPRRCACAARTVSRCHRATYLLRARPLVEHGRRFRARSLICL